MRRADSTPLRDAIRCKDDGSSQTDQVHSIGRVAKLSATHAAPTEVQEIRSIRRTADVRSVRFSPGYDRGSNSLPTDRAQSQHPAAVYSRYWASTPPSMKRTSRSMSRPTRFSNVPYEPGSNSDAARRCRPTLRRARFGEAESRSRSQASAKHRESRSGLAPPTGFSRCTLRESRCARGGT